MFFYLGTHEPTWLSKSHVPLFLSAIRLAGRCKRKLPRARVRWALDSGGYSCLTTHGRHLWTAEEYAALVRKWAEEIGNLDWAAVQDWMTEAEALAATGLTIEEHQRRTVQSYADLKRIAPELPWLPVLQGQSRDDYFRHLEMYAAAGFDLTDGRTVGIGSVCRREDDREAVAIIRELAARGVVLHAFGFKTTGVEKVADVIASSDSLAWSSGARHQGQARRRAAEKAAATPSLFEDCRPDVASAQNDAATALKWLDTVRVSAGILPETGLCCCPWCQSRDVCFPVGGASDYCCVECGESWGDVREPSLV